jgi:hypothetical protein
MASLLTFHGVDYTSELYTCMWKADFSQWRNQKVKPKMADFEAIPLSYTILLEDLLGIKP